MQTQFLPTFAASAFLVMRRVEQDRGTDPGTVAPGQSGRSYNAGRAIGSVFMTTIGFATAVMPLGTAIALFSTLAHALMIVMLLLLPETRGRAIGSLEPEAPGPAFSPAQPAVGRG